VGRTDFRATDRSIDPKEFIRALMIVTVKQFNQLRALHGLPDLTKAQVLNAIKAEMRT